MLICVMFLFLFGTLTSLLEDELLVILWIDIFAFSLHVKLLLNYFTLCEDLSHSLFFVVWYMPLECLHNDLGLTLSDAFLTHIHVWIWFRQFGSDEPTTRWACLEMFLLIALFEHAYPFIVLQLTTSPYPEKPWLFLP